MALVLSFCSVFVKGFQHKNVNGNHKKLITATSFIMALGDYFMVGLLVKSDWTIAIACGAGAALGMITSVHIHEKFIK